MKILNAACVTLSTWQAVHVSLEAGSREGEAEAMTQTVQSMPGYELQHTGRVDVARRRRRQERGVEKRSATRRTRSDQRARVHTVVPWHGTEKDMTVIAHGLGYMY